MGELCFDFVEAGSAAELWDLVSAGRRWALKAGGTDLLVSINRGLCQPELVIGLKKMPGAGEIRPLPDGGLELGACVTVASLLDNDYWRQRPCLFEAARQFASPRIRSLATVGGNLCNGSPVADLAVALTACGASCTVETPGGSCDVAIEEFLAGKPEGVFYLSRVGVPAPPKGEVGAFLKYARTAGSALALVSCGVAVAVEGAVCREVRVALGGVGPSVVRSPHAEGVLVGEALTPEAIKDASEMVVRDIQPADDFRGSAEYKAHIASVLVYRALARASGGA